jgi:hypothetical protein
MRRRLADERTRPSHAGREGRVEPEMGFMTRAVGPMTRMPAPRLLDRRSSARPPRVLAQTSRDDDRGGHGGLAALADDGRDRRGRRDDDGQVHLLRDGGHVGVALDAQDARPIGVDGIDGPAEGAGDEVGEDGAADAAGLLRSADESHGLPEERLSELRTGSTWERSDPGWSGVTVMRSRGAIIGRTEPDGPVIRAVRVMREGAPSAQFDACFGRRLLGHAGD